MEDRTDRSKSQLALMVVKKFPGLSISQKAQKVGVGTNLIKLANRLDSSGDDDRMFDTVEEALDNMAEEEPSADTQESLQTKTEEPTSIPESDVSMSMEDGPTVDELQARIDKLQAWKTQAKDVLRQQQARLAKLEARHQEYLFSYAQIDDLIAENVKLKEQISCT